MIPADERIPLPVLAQREGKCTRTIGRWCTEGVRGTVLQSFVVGGRRYTSESFYQDWLKAINQRTATQNDQELIA